MSRKRTSPVHGWIVLDKPEGITSTGAVGRLKHFYGSRKAGHAGTLDPLASGCLPIAFGEATKTVPYIVDATKTYEFTVHWGVETETLDREGETTRESNVVPSDAQIDAMLPEFIGEIDQVPPKFSAILVNGKRAYDLAREGEKVELKARKVTVLSLRRTGPTENNETSFEAVCGKGTYIRSFARDFAAQLGTVAHITRLRRTRVGPFGPDQMISLALLEEMRHKGAGSQEKSLVDQVRGLETALDDIPAVATTPEQASRIKSGQAVLLKGREAPVIAGQCLVTCHGKPVAIARVEEAMIKPERVFNLPND